MKPCVAPCIRQSADDVRVDVCVKNTVTGELKRDVDQSAWSELDELVLYANSLMIIEEEDETIESGKQQIDYGLPL